MSLRQPWGLVRRLSPVEQDSDFHRHKRQFGSGQGAYVKYQWDVLRSPLRVFHR